MSKIKLLVMDVDGTLTDGCIYISPEGEVMKAFHVQDGYGIVHILPKLGIIPAIITGRKSGIVERRANEIGIKHLYQGVTDKLSELKKLAESLNVSADEIAYIGDDLNDIECMEFCGLSACPGDSIEKVKNTVDYICEKFGGRGAVREFIDKIINI